MKTGPYADKKPDKEEEEGETSKKKVIDLSERAAELVRWLGSILKLEAVGWLSPCHSNFAHFRRSLLQVSPQSLS